MVKWRFVSRFGAKFNTVRRLSVLSLATFLLFFLLEVIFLGRGESIALFQTGEIYPLFRYLFCRQLAVSLLFFLLGVTVYAPAALFLTAIFRGLASGYVLSCLFPAALQWRPVLFFAAAVLYLLLLAFLQLGYTTFLAAVSLALFTPPLPARGENARLFGGSLFYSRYFCTRVNLRFLSSYLLFFLFYLALVALLVFLYVLLCSVL